MLRLQAPQVPASPPINPLPARHHRLGQRQRHGEGQQAAWAGDATGCGSTVIEGSPDVFINGKPAAVQGDATGCGGSIVTGSSGVFINGKPMAASGDAAPCPGK